MSNREDYNDGYQNGYWFGKDDGYRRGYEEGQQAERNRIKRAIDDDSTASELSPSSLITIPLMLAFLWWCFMKFLLFLAWVGGYNENFIFQLAYQIFLWGGIGVIIIMGIVGIIMAITEGHETKNSPEQPTNTPNPSRSDEYPPKEVFKAHPVTNSSTPWREEDPPEDAP